MFYVEDHVATRYGTPAVLAVMVLFVVPCLLLLWLGLLSELAGVALIFPLAFLVGVVLTLALRNAPTVPSLPLHVRKRRNAFMVGSLVYLLTNLPHLLAHALGAHVGSLVVLQMIGIPATLIFAALAYFWEPKRLSNAVKE